MPFPVWSSSYYDSRSNHFLFFRNTRFEQYLQNIDHSLDFVNEALTAGMLLSFYSFKYFSYLLIKVLKLLY